MYSLLTLILLQIQFSVYVVKNNLHTGIVFPAESAVTTYIPAAENFINHKYIDIGWGDEDFYQDPDPDYLLGAKAILVPTNSVVRIEGLNSTINKIVKWSDFSIRFDLNDEQFKNLCEFVNGSFLKNSDKNLIITSQKNNNRIIFYKSRLKYHLFNTCNTWIAEAFESCGFDISSSNVITAENLFEEISKYGTVLKREFTNN